MAGRAWTRPAAARLRVGRHRAAGDGSARLPRAPRRRDGGEGNAPRGGLEGRFRRRRRRPQDPLRPACRARRRRDPAELHPHRPATRLSPRRSGPLARGGDAPAPGSGPAGAGAVAGDGRRARARRVARRPVASEASPRAGPHSARPRGGRCPGLALPGLRRETPERDLTCHSAGIRLGRAPGARGQKPLGAARHRLGSPRDRLDGTGGQGGPGVGGGACLAGVVADHPGELSGRRRRGLHAGRRAGAPRPGARSGRSDRALRRGSRRDPGRLRRPDRRSRRSSGRSRSTRSSCRPASFSPRR